MFFPECWGHSVYTYKGPNFMLNYRSFWKGNFLYQPLTWTSAAFFNLFFFFDLLFKYMLTSNKPVAADLGAKKPFTSVPKTIHKDYKGNILKVPKKNPTDADLVEFPTNGLKEKISGMFAEMCEKEGALTDFDKQMIDIMQTEVNRFKNGKSQM